ncbi:hypothetical protein F4775DRAFT_254481 [Biscogniauxia sp. FL1348]|nr:hypothetical protein F4775DRAFT_254481 [Biscogniauxia sp. FL1348]
MYLPTLPLERPVVAYTTNTTKTRPVRFFCMGQSSRVARYLGPSWQAWLDHLRSRDPLASSDPNEEDWRAAPSFARFPRALPHKMWFLEIGSGIRRARSLPIGRITLRYSLVTMTHIIRSVCVPEDVGRILRSIPIYKASRMKPVNILETSKLENMNVAVSSVYIGRHTRPQNTNTKGADSKISQEPTPIPSIREYHSTCPFYKNNACFFFGPSPCKR